MNSGLTENGLNVATDKEKLMVYIDKDVKEGLRQLAEMDGRSMSNFVEQMIKNAVESAKLAGKIQQGK
jgi:predicted HicB family RNase H-like nuclease